MQLCFALLSCCAGKGNILINLKLLIGKIETGKFNITSIRDRRTGTNR
jgi:hypothetical protein